MYLAVSVRFAAVNGLLTHKTAFILGHNEIETCQVRAKTYYDPYSLRSDSQQQRLNAFVRSDHRQSAVDEHPVDIDIYSSGSLSSSKKCEFITRTLDTIAQPQPVQRHTLGFYDMKLKGSK